MLLKKQTFIIEVEEVQDGSWQGSIEWLQGKKKQPFRSVMELLSLMDSAVEKRAIDSNRT